MIWYIILLFPISFGESAIFYNEGNDGKDDSLNVELFKLLGLKVNTNYNALSNALSQVILSHAEKIDGQYDESVPVKLTLAVDTNKNEHNTAVPNSFDYKEACKALVGTSSTPLCRLTQRINKDEKHHLPRSCQEILESGINKSGIYQIHPRTSSKPFSVLCDMETKGGGWTHIQKRFDGSQDFYLSWREYKFGFGDLEGEFWIGLENIYHMTGFEISELLIELTDREQKQAYAQYSHFAIGAEKEGYNLKYLKGFSGDAGDALTPHLSMKFTTKDVHEDTHTTNCAVLYEGAWWYGACHSSNLNGKHMNKPLGDEYKFHGLNWNGYRAHDYNLAGSRMLVRPVGNH